jgi:glycosyltransferase involved in cell wall biosynthesis
MNSTGQDLSGEDINPLLTIAIPTFNRASWLKRCVTAALEQSYRNIEVLVLDNASTDRTPEVLSEFDDNRLRVVRQSENIGPGRNCASCINEARGEYVVIVPDDDKIFPWMLEKCVALIRKEPTLPVIMAIGDVLHIPLDRTLPANCSQRLSTGIWSSADILTEYLDDGLLSMHQCTVLMRTDAVRANGGFELDCPSASDIATYLPLLRFGRAGFINESCGIYSVHTSTQTAAFGLEARLRDFRKVVSIIRDASQNAPVDIRVRRKLELSTRGFAARHAFGLISSYRGTGVPLADLLPFFSQWKRELWSGLPFMGINRSTLRFLALLALPLPITNMVRGGLRQLRPKSLPGLKP